MAQAAVDFPSLTIREASKATRMSEPYIRRAIWSGALASYKFGSRILIHPDDLAAFVKSKRQQPAVPA